MAEALGVDLTDALAQGVLAGEDWRDAVLRCTCCEDPEACLAWLGARNGALPAPAGPEICRNTAMFDDLRHEAASGGGV